jgi:hypothetical protein
MKYIIDRFEGDLAVCEDAEMNRIEISRTLLPEGAREGSAVAADENGVYRLIDDTERVSRIADKMKSVFKGRI